MRTASSVDRVTDEAVRGAGCLILMLGVLHFVAADATLVDGVPGVGNVGQHEGDGEACYRHDAQGELAGAAVGQAERTLRVGVRGIVGRVVEACEQQYAHDGQHGADAGVPDAARLLAAPHGAR